MILSIYGKGGIGKSTTSSNIAIAMAKRGARVLQVGCDPKHDSTFTITKKMIPTLVEVLEEYDYHHEEIEPEDVIFKGKMGVDAMESGGPAAGAGCGGYVTGEAVKFLKDHDLMDQYDVVIFDVLGDVVCGGFATPLNHSDFACVVTANDFDSLFAANRICAAVTAKGKNYPIFIAGLIVNRCPEIDHVQKFCDRTGARVIGHVPQIDEIRRSRLAGVSIFEMKRVGGIALAQDRYLEIADYVLGQPEPLKVNPLSDREVFEHLRSEYLNINIEKFNAEDLELLEDPSVLTANA
jgi:light-independent protochlorophyllide reductase subunit L